MLKKILNECGFAYIWNTQTFVDPNWLRLTIIRNLQDQFEQYWHSLLDDASKATDCLKIILAWKYTLIF
jgi:hypothetical protein